MEKCTTPNTLQSPRAHNLQRDHRVRFYKANKNQKPRENLETNGAIQSNVSHRYPQLGSKDEMNKSYGNRQRKGGIEHNIKYS